MDTEMRFQACGVALITPFNADKSIDFGALKTIIANCLEAQVSYFVVLGTTAETPCLSNDEKKEVVQFCKNEIAGKAPIMVGFSGNNTAVLTAEIAAFDFEGIDALLCASPYYNKPSQEGIYEHYSQLANVAPKPIVLYNIPGRTSSNMSADTILKLAKDFDNIIGVKEASGNMSQIMQISQRKQPGFLLISGDDSLTLPIASIGGNGIISVLANALPAKMQQLTAHALSDEVAEARKIHNDLLPLFGALSEEGNPTGIKALLNAMGITNNNLRLPLVRASSELSNKINFLFNNLKK